MVPSTPSGQHDQVDRGELGHRRNTRSLEVDSGEDDNASDPVQNLDGRIHGGRLTLDGGKWRRQDLMIRSSNVEAKTKTRFTLIEELANLKALLAQNFAHPAKKRLKSEMKIQIVPGTVEMFTSLH